MTEVSVEREYERDVEKLRWMSLNSIQIGKFNFLYVCFFKKKTCIMVFD